MALIDYGKRRSPAPEPTHKYDEKKSKKELAQLQQSVLEGSYNGQLAKDRKDFVQRAQNRLTYEGRVSQWLKDQ